jgi:hypothetical protein
MRKNRSLRFKIIFSVVIYIFVSNYVSYKASKKEGL